MEQPVVVTADIKFPSPLVLSLPAACFLLLGMLLLSAATNYLMPAASYLLQ